MAQVRITDSSGTERNTFPLIGLRKQQIINEVTLATVVISRSDLNSLSTFKPGEDRLFVEDPPGTDTFGGVIRTPGRSGANPELLVDSFAEYMRRAKPVPVGQQKTAVDDSVLIKETIDATPQLTQGTINTLLSGETWVFSGVTQFAKAAKVAEAAGGELVFNPDLSVDYLDSRGSDKTNTTLSPTNQSFVDDKFNVDRDGQSGNITHLKVYGVGQGTSQIEATIVPGDDTGSYTNKATYTNSEWSSGDDKIWGRRTNKDLKNVNALKAWGLNIIEDLQNLEITVTTNVKGNDVLLGDKYHLKHSEEGVDDNLRAVEVSKLIAADGGTRYETTFSNYSVARHEIAKENHKDIGRYNQAFEGDLTTIQQSPGRGPVDSTHDYVIDVYYPDDVVLEVDAQLLIKGLNYRSYVAANSHSHSVDVTHPSHDHVVKHPSHTHDVTHPSHSHDVSATSTSKDTGETLNAVKRIFPQGETDAASTSDVEDVFAQMIASPTGTDSGCVVTGVILNATGSSQTHDYNVVNNTTGTTLESGTLTVANGASESVNVEDPNATVDDEMAFEITSGTLGSASGAAALGYHAIWVNSLSSHNHDVSDTSTTALGTTETSTTALGVNTTSDTALGTTQSETSAAVVGFDPGLNDWDGTDKSPAHYPENVKVVTPSSTIDLGTSGTFQSGSDDGTGAFEATLDLTGELSSGWNEIRLESDGLGHIFSSFSADLFRQSL